VSAGLPLIRIPVAAADRCALHHRSRQVPSPTRTPTP